MYSFGRDLVEFTYRLPRDTLKKPHVVYCKVPQYPNAEFRKPGPFLYNENEANKPKEYYFCHSCRQNKDFETSLACLTKCFHDYCSNCYFQSVNINETPHVCLVCGARVGKVLVTDRRVKPSYRLKLLEDLPTNTSGSNVCSLIKNFEKKIETQYLLFCPFKLNGCRQKLTLPLSRNFEPDELNDFASHLMDNHNMYICGLCIYRNHFWPIHVTFYNEPEFLEHLQSNHVYPISSSNEIDGFRHVICPFCNCPAWFMDQQSLLRHCKRSHVECEICKEVFAATEANMIKHYRKDHAWCQFCQKPFALYSYVDHLQNAHPIESKTLRQQILDNAETGESLLKKFTEDEIKQLSLSGLASDDVWKPSSNTEAYMMNFPSIDGKARKIVQPPAPSGPSVFYKAPYSQASSYSNAFPSLGNDDGKFSDNPMIGSSAAAAAAAKAITSTTNVDKKNKPNEWSKAVTVKKTNEQIPRVAYPSLAKPKQSSSSTAIIPKPSQTKPEEPPKVEHQRWAKMLVGTEQFRFKMAKPKIHSEKKTTVEAKIEPPELSSSSDFPDLDSEEISAPKLSETSDPARKKQLKKKIDWTAEIDWKSFCEPKEKSEEKDAKIPFTINPPIDEDKKKNGKTRGNNGGKAGSAQEGGHVLPPLLFGDFPALDPIIESGGRLQYGPSPKATMSATSNKDKSGGDASKNSKKKNNYKKPGSKK